MAIRKVEVNGKIKYEVIVKIRDSSGKQVMRRRRWFGSEREAKKVEFDLRYELEGHKTKITWNDWVNSCLERCRLEYRHSTWLNYQTVLAKWVTPLWKEKFIDEITTSDVHDLVFHQVQGVSFWHRRNVLKYVRRVFAMAVEDGIILRNPTLKIKVKVPEAVQKVLAPKEIEVLLREAKSLKHRFYEIWTLALLTGMRNGELYSLKWTSVDLEAGFINVTSSWTKKDGFGTTKSAKNRVVPISPACRKFLTELKLERGNEPFVLPHFQEWERGDQARVLRGFCHGLGLTPVKFHDLRATFITQMLRNGVALAKVMSIVGHTELKTTQGYLRLCGQDVKGATDDLGIDIPEESGADNVYSLTERR